MKSTVLLEHHLKQLRLPTILREYASLARNCAQEQCDYQTYLLRLTERELNDRQQKAAQRRIKSARFPVIKTLDSFDFTVQPSINEHLVRQLIVGEYIERHENVLSRQQRHWQNPPGVFAWLCRMYAGQECTLP